MRFGERRNGLTHSRLLACLSYDPLTGVFTWKIEKNSFGGKVKVGVAAGQLDRHGHRQIGIDGYVYSAHRLAWFYVHGSWPIGQIDHKNMCRDDNRLENLREATFSLQRANQRVRADSALGVKGVERTKIGRFRARLKGRHIGTFGTLEEASAAYARAATEAFGDFARVA